MAVRKGLSIALTCWVLGLAGCEEAGSEHDSAQGQVGEAVSTPKLMLTEDEDLTLGENAQPLIAQQLCKTCATSADCGGAPNYCLRRSDGARFCGADCRNTACPGGFSCTRLSFNVYQCVPPQGDCSRAAAPDAGTRDAGTASAGADAGPPDAGPADAATASAPDASSCAAAAATWDPSWVAFEDEVLRLSNQYRQAGAVCDTTSYPPVPPLAPNAALRCSARLHSKDMQDRNYFSHTTPDGVTFDQRISQAGYRWRALGENIALGYSTPQSVVQGWMQSPGHCQNIMSAAFSELGVGFYGDNRWTQDFGSPL
jgi:uncharacterized protein YkwD